MGLDLVFTQLTYRSHMVHSQGFREHNPSRWLAILRFSIRSCRHTLVSKKGVHLFPAQARKLPQNIHEKSNRYHQINVPAPQLARTSGGRACSSELMHLAPVAIVGGRRLVDRRLRLRKLLLLLLWRRLLRLVSGDGLGAVPVIRCLRHGHGARGVCAVGHHVARHEVARLPRLLVTTLGGRRRAAVALGVSCHRGAAVLMIPYLRLSSRSVLVRRGCLRRWSSLVVVLSHLGLGLDLRRLLVLVLGRLLLLAEDEENCEADKSNDSQASNNASDDGTNGSGRLVVVAIVVVVVIIVVAGGVGSHWICGGASSGRSEPAGRTRGPKARSSVVC